MFHLLYQTLNPVTNKYYINMHSTTDLDDGYMGSGIAISAPLGATPVPALSVAIGSPRGIATDTTGG